MQCSSPVEQNVGEFSFIRRCGQCAPCILYKSATWTARALCEWVDNNKSGQFCTLTYANDYLPQNDHRHWSYAAYRRDVQPFLKRLRHMHELRFMCVPDEGDQFQRPHWHLLFYPRNGLIRESDIQETWHSGFASISELNHARVRYTCRYVTKKLQGLEAGRIYCSREFGKARMVDWARSSAASQPDRFVDPLVIKFDRKRYPIGATQRSWYRDAYRAPDFGNSKEQTLMAAVPTPATREHVAEARVRTLTLHEHKAQKRQLFGKDRSTLGSSS